jgi:hypothetical protein
MCELSAARAIPQGKNHQKLISDHLWQSFKREPALRAEQTPVCPAQGTALPTLKSKTGTAMRASGGRQSAGSIACQNMKNMAQVLGRKAKKEAEAARFYAFTGPPGELRLLSKPPADQNCVWNADFTETRKPSSGRL